MNAVAETTVFAAKAAALLTDAERAEVIEMLARNPECGAVIPGTGGVRKVRIALEGRGKSGGAQKTPACDPVHLCHHRYQFYRIYQALHDQRPSQCLCQSNRPPAILI